MMIHGVGLNNWMDNGITDDIRKTRGEGNWKRNRFEKETQDSLNPLRWLWGI